MKNEKIIEYIKQSFDSGKTEEEIKSNLLSVGWVTGQVEEALAFLRDNPKFKKRSLIQKLFFGLISIITNIGFIVFVFGSGLMFFFRPIMDISISSNDSVCRWCLGHFDKEFKFRRFIKKEYFIS